MFSFSVIYSLSDSNILNTTRENRATALTSDSYGK